MRNRPAHAAAGVAAVGAIALVFFFGLVWFGIASPNEVWRLVALPLPIGLAIGLALKLVEALVSRMRARRG